MSRHDLNLEGGPDTVKCIKFNRDQAIAAQAGGNGPKRGWHGVNGAKVPEVVEDPAPAFRESVARQCFLGGHCF